MSADGQEALAQLLERHRGEIEAFVRRHAGSPLLRFESVDDLLAGVAAQALGARFEERSDPEFQAWIKTIARRYLIARREYWFALKRDSGRLLRLSLTGSSGDLTPLPLADTSTGPATSAQRRDQFVRATKALAVLLPRDRQLVQWSVDSIEVEEMARRLQLSRSAAERALQRAYERLRKAYLVVAGT